MIIKVDHGYEPQSPGYIGSKYLSLTNQAILLPLFQEPADFGS